MRDEEGREMKTVLLNGSPVRKSHDYVEGGVMCPGGRCPSGSQVQAEVRCPGGSQMSKSKPGQVEARYEGMEFVNARKCEEDVVRKPDVQVQVEVRCSCGSHFK